MTHVRLPYIHAFLDRHGKSRRYVRLPGGKRFPLPGKPGSAEFMAAYQAALDGREVQQTAPAIGAERTLAGSIDAAIVGYLGHETYLKLAPSSRATRRQSLEMLRREHGTKPIAALQPQHVRALLGARKPSIARNLLNALKALMHFAMVAGLVREDPTTSMKSPRIKTGTLHSWTEPEIEQYRAAHRIGTTARLALELALNTACRRSDLIAIGPQHIRNGLFTYTQQKTASIVAMPVHADLPAVLGATPATDLRFLMASTGRPFTPATFGIKFRDWCDEAGLPKNCSVHGLRKAQARRLAEAGCSAHQIASVTGHKTLAEVQRYAAAADRERMARTAMASVTAAFPAIKTET